jgi:hypothetical protein
MMPRTAADKFNELVKTKVSEKRSIANTVQPDIVHPPYSLQQNIAQQIPGEYNFANTNVISNPAAEMFASKSNPMMPPPFMMDLTKLIPQQIPLQQNLGYGNGEYGMPAPQSNLLNDLRQSNQSGQPTNDVNIPQPFFMNQHQMPFMFPPGLPMPMMPFGQGNMPLIHNQFLGMPMFNPMAVNMASLAQSNISQISMLKTPFNTNDPAMISVLNKDSMSFNQAPADRQRFDNSQTVTNPRVDQHGRDQIPGLQLHQRMDQAEKGPLDFIPANEFDKGTSSEQFNQPINPMSNMMFNFENANEEPGDEMEASRTEAAHLKPALTSSETDKADNGAHSPVQAPVDEEDQELIELVRENDSETLAECYLDADESLRRLLLDKIQQYAPEKVGSVMQLIQNK